MSEPGVGGEADDPLIGSSIAGYRVEGVLGRGGMGAVYCGYDPGLRRKVAIKLMLPQHQLDNEARKRFEREATLAAGITHPNVAAVYAFELTDDNRPALIMQCVDGSDLATVLKEGAVHTDRALRILGELCDAISCVHAQGLVHRDIKPENVLLESCGTPDERALLTDFGIARSKSSQTALTIGPIGTVEYMAPEVVDWQAATELSDQYSLACVIYRMLTGEVLFGDLELPLAHKSEELPDLEKLLPGIARPARAALVRALDKDPAKRFPSVDAFAEAFVQNEPEAPQKPQSLQATMEAVLSEAGGTLTVAEVAAKVNERRAGTVDPVTPLQIEGRARLFSQLFARREDGRLALRDR